MTQETFTQRTGIELTEDLFKKVNAAYEATAWTMEHFCDTMKDNPVKVVAEVGRELTIYKNAYLNASKEVDNLAAAALAHAKATNDDKLVEEVAKRTSPKFVIVWKIENNVALKDAELAYLKLHL